MNETNTKIDLLTLLHEVNDRMYKMMEYCERLQPVKLDTERNDEQFEYNGDYYKSDDTPITVDLDITDEMYSETKLFRLLDPELDEHKIFDDQTGRSILKDLRKVIRSLEK